MPVEFLISNQWVMHTICLQKYEGSSACGLHNWFIDVVISMQGVTMKSSLRPCCLPWPPLKVSH